MADENAIDLGLYSSSSNISTTTDLAIPLVSESVREFITILLHTILGIPLNFAGCVGNVINIIVFLKLGFKDTINIGLFGLAIADLLSLITLQWVNICATPWFRYSELLPFESFEIQYLTGGWPHTMICRVVALLTAYIAFERCLCVTMPLHVKSILTPKKTTLFVVGTFVLLALSTIPIYTVNGFGWKYYPPRNKTLVGIVFFGDKQLVESVAFSLNNVYGYVAFISVITCTCLLIKTLKNQSKWKMEQGTAGQNKSVRRDRKAVVMVTTISIIFIVCYFPITLIYIGIMVEPEFSLIGKYQNLVHSLFPFGLFLESINSSVNILIYVKMNSKFQAAFNTLIGHHSTVS